MSYSRQAARLLRPSTRTRRRISAQFSMSMYTHRPHGGRTWMGVSETLIVVPSPRARPWALRFLADHQPPARATFSHRPSQTPFSDIAMIGGVIALTRQAREER